MADLHASLKTTTVLSLAGATTDFTLTTEQQSRDEFKFVLHAVPKSRNLSGGIDAGKLLAAVGFPQERPCAAHGRREASCMSVRRDFDLQPFSPDFEQALGEATAADADLAACGYSIPCGKQFQPWVNSGSGGDGHRGEHRSRLKDSADENFDFAFSWIELQRGRGWTTHVHPRHWPPSSEMVQALTGLGLSHFDSCPEFDFDDCFWRFSEGKGDRFDADYQFTDAAHRMFDAHQARFTPGVHHLLNADALLRKHGFPLLSTHQSTTAHRPHTTPSRGQPVSSTASGTHIAVSSGGTGNLTDEGQEQLDDLASLTFDVAISYAGPQRDIAERIADRLRSAGHVPFFDRYYAAQLWGKDQTEAFERIYGRQAKFCLMLISAEYRDRIWTTHERRAALSRAVEQRDREYILPVQCESEAVQLDGLPASVNYISIAQHSPDEIADMIIAKLQTRPAGN